MSLNQSGGPSNLILSTLTGINFPVLQTYFYPLYLFLGTEGIEPGTFSMQAMGSTPETWLPPNKMAYTS